MKNVNVNEMVEVSIEDVISRSGYDISEWFEVFESGVYKVNYGSRGEIEEVSKVEVKDGVFEVESEEEFDGLFDGVLSISRGEEDNDEYYLVK
tara:strand:- start:40 stop:318 length:279 start_codon:yes stop_codon:yes gene_type:complete